MLSFYIHNNKSLRNDQFCLITAMTFSLSITYLVAKCHRPTGEYAIGAEETAHLVIWFPSINEMSDAAEKKWQAMKKSGSDPMDGGGLVAK